VIRWKLWKRWLRMKAASTTRRDVFEFSVGTVACAFAFLIIAAWCFHG